MADEALASVVTAVARVLARFGRHMVIGGVAVIAHGVRRLTDDVDFTLWADRVDLELLLARLETAGVVPRIADVLSFARNNQVLLLRHSASGIDVDLSLAWLPFESDALDRADIVRLGRGRMRVATADDLIVYKAIAARERDRSDIERLLEIHGSKLDLDRVRRTVSELAEALERPELVLGLDELVRASLGSRRPRRRQPTPARATKKAPKRRARRT